MSVIIVLATIILVLEVRDNMKLLIANIYNKQMHVEASEFTDLTNC